MAALQLLLTGYLTILQINLIGNEVGQSKSKETKQKLNVKKKTLETA